MMVLQRLVVVLVIIVTAVGHVQALLDGRSTIVSVDSMYTFTDGECAFGFVYFNKGITVPAGAVAYLDILPPVQGPINLNGTGTLVLNSPLRLGVQSEGFPLGGIIQTNNGEQGLMVLQNDVLLTTSLVFKNSMAINGAKNRLTLSSTGTNRGSLVIDNTVSQTIYLRNLSICGVEDFSAGFGPKFRGSSVIAGRHGIGLLNTELLFVQDGTATFTGVDLIAAAGTSAISCSVASTVAIKTALFINDLARLQLKEGILMELDTVLTSSYFNIGNGGGLLLNNASMAFNQPIRFPSPVLAKNSTSSLVVAGDCALIALGAGEQTQCILGVASPAGPYLYDPFVDVYPGARMTLDNVQLIDNTSLA